MKKKEREGSRMKLILKIWGYRLLLCLELAAIAEMLSAVILLLFKSAAVA